MVENGLGFFLVGIVPELTYYEVASETRGGKTAYARWKHCKRAVEASRSLRQKARIRKESGLCFDHETILGAIGW